MLGNDNIICLLLSSQCDPAGLTPVMYRQRGVWSGKEHFPVPGRMLRARTLLTRKSSATLPMSKRDLKPVFISPCNIPIVPIL